jgi:hypothetical protein
MRYGRALKWVKISFKVNNVVMRVNIFIGVARGEDYIKNLDLVAMARF